MYRIIYFSCDAAKHFTGKTENRKNRIVSNNIRAQTLLRVRNFGDCRLTFQSWSADPGRSRSVAESSEL